MHKFDFLLRLNEYDKQHIRNYMFYVCLNRLEETILTSGNI